MSKKSQQQIAAINKQIETIDKRRTELQKKFARGGINKQEQAILDALQKQIDQKIEALKRKGAVQVIDIEEAEVIEVPVTKGDPGIPFEQQIVNLLQDFEDAIQNYWQNYHIAIDNFDTTMSFASDQEAAPQHLQAVFKALAKQAFDDGLKYVGTKLGGPWGEIISYTKTAMEAWAKEDERVAAAAGQVKVRDYIVSIRNGIPKQRDTMIAGVESRKRPLIEHFRKAAAGRISKDGHAIGEPAQLLISLTAEVAAFKTAIPKPQFFQKQFSTKFADTPGKTDLVSHGGIPSGTIYFDVFLKVEPEDENPWKKGKMGESWRLVTKAPNPDRVASSLAQSLDGKKPWQIDLPKMVSMSIEVEEFGPNHVQEGNIYFTKSPDQFEVRSNYGEKWFKEAWMTPGIRKQILDVDKLTGSSK
jgi:hypothetical protein